MPMQTVHLLTDAQDPIPVKLASSDDATLLECHAADRFLAHVTEGRWRQPLAPGAYLRGIVVPREGAVFSLCGPLGLLEDEVVRLSEADARRLVLDRLK
jgi:hypothetical protein